MSGRVEDMMKKLTEEVPHGKFVTIECDLQKFDSVRAAAKEIKSKYPKIYCLSCNAGIMATPDRATVDGYEEQMQTNHFSHFLLAAELFPLLEKEANDTGDARIVSHSSTARNGTSGKGFALERKYFEKTHDGKLGGDKLGLFSGPCFERYCQTKLANSVFMHALDDKLKAKGSKVKSLAAHPGASATALGDHLDFGRISNFLANWIIFPLIAQSSEDGTMGLLKCMVDEKAESGVLYGPKGAKGLPVVNPAMEWETDVEAMKMLWETSEAATGVKFL
jgi:NAD(P)-dependent dehydrogenase (short-subunit alcohol dehydrogenase family)